MRRGNDEAWQRIVEAAEEILGERVGLVPGCRKLLKLMFDLQVPDQEVFGPIRGFESETDHYPLGEVRRQYSQEYLDRVDREVAEYAQRAGPAVLAACRKIVADHGRRH